MTSGRAALFLAISFLLFCFSSVNAASAREDIFDPAIKNAASSSSSLHIDESVLEVLSEIRGLGNRINVPQVFLPVAKVTAISWNRFFFDASSTYSSGDEPLTYLWDFGDGTNSLKIKAEHKYNPGKYEAALEVADTRGVIKELKFPVEVGFWNLRNRYVQFLIAFLSALALSFLTYSFIKR